MRAERVETVHGLVVFRKRKCATSGPRGHVQSVHGRIGFGEAAEGEQERVVNRVRNPAGVFRCNDEKPV